MFKTKVIQIDIGISKWLILKWRKKLSNWCMLLHTVIQNDIFVIIWSFLWVYPYRDKYSNRQSRKLRRTAISAVSKYCIYIWKTNSLFYTYKNIFNFVNYCVHLFCIRYNLSSFWIKIIHKSYVYGMENIDWLL